MTIVHRRVFYGKVGSADEVIEHIQQGNILMRGSGLAVKPRIMSDFQSGRTDRVVMEWEVEDFAEVYAVQDEMTAYPEGEETFREWFSKLADLIHYAEVENWLVH